MRYRDDWKGYEIALYETLLYEFPPPYFRVKPNETTLKGRYSLADRQLDVAVYRRGEDRPFLVADAKFYGKALDVKDVEAFIGMLEDVGAGLGVLTCPMGYSPAAVRRAKASAIDTRIVTREESLELRWREVARDVYPWDWLFHPELGSALYRLEHGGRTGEILDALESIEFEEWSAFVSYGLSHHREEAEVFLMAIAQEHLDEGWRFNAVQRLLDAGALEPNELKELRAGECDPDVLDLLAGNAEGYGELKPDDPDCT